MDGLHLQIVIIQTIPQAFPAFSFACTSTQTASKHSCTSKRAIYWNIANMWKARCIDKRRDLISGAANQICCTYMYCCNHRIMSRDAGGSCIKSTLHDLRLCHAHEKEDCISHAWKIPRHVTPSKRCRDQPCSMTGHDGTSLRLCQLPSPIHRHMSCGEHGTSTKAQEVGC